MTCVLHEYRCRDCHKLLFKGLLVEGELEVKCKTCHTLNVVTVSQFNELLCLIPKCPHRISLRHNLTTR